MYARILVPLDGSATASRGFQEACALAKRLGSTLHLLHVVDARLLIAEMSVYLPPDQMLQSWRSAGEKLIGEAIAQAREQGLTADGVVRSDPAQRVCDVIVQEATNAKAELIVMGTHGRRGFKRVALGSDAELVLRESPVPVLLVRGHSKED